MTTVSLANPIAIGPVLYSSLTFHPVKFGDFGAIAKAMTLNDLDDVVALVAKLADVDFDVAASIHPDDLVPVLTAVTSHVERHAPKK